MAASPPATEVEVAGRRVRITNPTKPWFPAAGLTKIDVVRYWLALGEVALTGVSGRPMALERFVHGADAPGFYQKRAPAGRPAWITVATLRFPSRRTADEIVVDDLAQLVWCVNLGCLSLHPHAVRVVDLHRPDELRIDLDPVPGVPFSEVRHVAEATRRILDAHGLVGWPKTSGKRGLHIWVRIAPRWSFAEVRQAALAVARQVEAQMPGRATSAWWKEERRGVFVDYNQNAKDRTTAAAWSVRPTPTATVSMPLTWDEVPTADPSEHTVRTAPARLAARGDPHAGIEDAIGDLTALLGLASDLEASLPPRPVAGASPTGRRQPTRPLITIGASEDPDAVGAGLDRWRRRFPEAAAFLEPHHVLVDQMRDGTRAWTRIRINLESVPAVLRPRQGDLDPDDAP